MLKTAQELLKKEYENNNINIIENTVYHVWYHEKWRHSMQVFGAGNYLVRHIEWLKDKPEDYIEMIKSAVLLHDIFRFKEVYLLANENKKIDHGVEGAKYLQTLPLFNDIRIWLPIYHHGHLIEDLYNDPQYQSIKNEELKKEIELICFIIRDADKIANLHMMAYEPEMRPLFLSSGSGNDSKDYSVSDFAKEDAFGGKTVRRTPECTIADRMLGYLSWYNDFNYRYSIDFCEKLNVTALLKDYFARICHDKNFVKEYFIYFDRCLRERAFLA